MNWLRKLFSFRDRRAAQVDSAASAEDADAHDGDVVKPFLEHLEDLRGTLFKMAAAIVSGGIVAFFFRIELFELARAPLKPLGIEIFSLELISPFTLSIKLSIYAGIVLSFPFLLYFIADFVLPALTRKEKRILLPGILVGFILFAIGVLIAYRLILPRTLEWLQSYARSLGLEANRVEVGRHISLVTNLCLACGALSELPIVVIGLALFGLVTHTTLAKTRAYVMTFILIVVAIIAPTPDPIMFLTLALPVLAIYEACIWITRLIERKRA